MYRDLEKGKSTQAAQPTPGAESVKDFWSSIWSAPANHDEEASWLPSVREACEALPHMPAFNIKLEDVEAAIRKTQNWRSPGPDGICNFWWKYLPATHKELARHFQLWIESPDQIPPSLTKGLTYLLYKSGDPIDPKNYRPITCLPTAYKLFTSVISVVIYDHSARNYILAAEQNGCRRNARGCKELLIIDKIVSTQVQNKQRNISIGWVDYRKAFDSVPHTWLLEVLSLYKIHPSLVKVLEACMSTWSTTLMIRAENTAPSVPVEIAVKRGIFQGNSLSPLWFCLALNPLSHLLNKTSYGYYIEKSNVGRVTHQFYMDDLKIYSKSADELGSMMEIVKGFSDDIQMEFGLDKCATLTVRRGRLSAEQDDLMLMSGELIQALSQDKTYKYLGIHQLLSVKTTQVRQTVQNKVYARVKKVCKTHLSGKNKITAINTWAIPVATYTFGVLDWSTTALQEFDRRIRSIMNKHRILHPRSSLHRLYLPRTEGGRGLLSLETMCNRESSRLGEYFREKRKPLVQCTQRQKIQLNSATLDPTDPDAEPLVVSTVEERKQAWKGMELHGRFATRLASPDIDRLASTEWLRTAHLFGETEGYVCAIQDQVISTRAYQRHVMKQDVEDKCRLCSKQLETIQHVVGGCSALAQTEYKRRHDNVAKVVHQALAKHHGLIKEEDPYYKCKPAGVMRNDKVRLLWDLPVVTDRTVEANKPDILLIDHQKKQALVIDIAVPLDDNLGKTSAEKRRKYQALTVELIDMYRLTEVKIVPVIVSVNGLVTHEWQRLPSVLPLNTQHLRTMQKAALLGTANIARKILSL